MVPITRQKTQNAFERLLAAAPAPAAVVAQEEEEPQQQNTQLLSSRQKLWNDGPRNILHLLNIWDSRIPLEPNVHIFWKIYSE